MSSLKEIRTLAKVTKAIDEFANAANVDDTLHNMFVEWLTYFVDVDYDEDEKLRIELNPDAKPRLLHWASEVVVPFTEEELTEKMSEEDIRWALHHILTHAKKIYGELKSMLSEEDYDQLIDKMNELIGGKKVATKATE